MVELIRKPMGEINTRFYRDLRRSKRQTVFVYFTVPAVHGP